MADALDLDALEALHAAASPGEWTAYRMVREGHERDMTAEELGEYVKNSTMKSEAESLSSEFLAILVQKPDGSADVCLVGNGPTSPANAKWIEASHNAAPELFAIVRAAQKLADCAAAVVVYHDNLPKHGTNQRPDLGVRIASLDAALDGYDDAVGTDDTLARDGGGR